jgi:hypothetical protein
LTPHNVDLWANFESTVLELISTIVPLLDERELARPDYMPYNKGYFGAAKALTKPMRQSGVTVKYCDYGTCPYRFVALSIGHLKIHLQDYHDEDVGYTGGGGLIGRTISFDNWRCSQCLNYNLVEISNGWKCFRCDFLCEEYRIKARAAHNSANG